jgi:hypothetical protein
MSKREFACFLTYPEGIESKAKPGKVNGSEGAREGALGYKVNGSEGAREGALGEPRRKRLTFCPGARAERPD